MVDYEFGGRLGVAAITFGLPLLLYAFAFACNDVSGCPVPTFLQPQDLTWEKLKADVGLLNAKPAAGGTTANVIYDFYICRELNPRVTLPLFGELDIKSWCEVYPGLTGWILLDLAFIAQQYRSDGYISDSIVFTAAAQEY
nr:delta(14)-sterol reductase [Aspergillus sp.]